MTRVPPAAAPKISKNPFSSIADENTTKLAKNLNSAPNSAPESLVAAPTIRKSPRFMKALNENDAATTQVADPAPTKDNFAMELDSIEDSPVPSEDKTMDLVDSSDDPSSPLIELPLESLVCKALDQLKDASPELAQLISSIFNRFQSELDTLKSSVAAIDLAHPPVSYASAASSTTDAFATAGKRPHSVHRKPTPVDLKVRNKSLCAAWESKPTINGRKRLCTDPTNDNHLNENAEEQFMVVHLAGFDLHRNEHRATPAAVLTEKFDLAPDCIINVSSMGPQIQELHIVASKLSDLQAAVAKTQGALKLSTKLDPRMPPNGSQETNAITESTRYFRDRLDREIYRLSKTKSHRLQNLADFLVLYKESGLRISAPRRRRAPMFASAFLDEAVFVPMVPDKI